MASGLRTFAATCRDGAGRPAIDEANGEEIMHVQSGVSIVLDNQPAEASGTLYITSKQVIWLSDLDTSKGYAIDFYSISLHAVSRDPEAYPLPCLYTQIDKEDNEADRDESDGSESELDGASLDLSKIKEMRLVPSDPNQLDILFEVFCECAELNPEPIEDEGEEHEWIFSADQMQTGAVGGEEPEWTFSDSFTNTIGYSNGDHDLSHNVLQLHLNDQRFEDAEEMDRDSNSGQH